MYTIYDTFFINSHNNNIDMFRNDKSGFTLSVLANVIDIHSETLARIELKDA